MKENKPIIYNKDLSLMMSIYNEEACLKEVSEELLNCLIKSKINFELFLVNNGSWDRSQQIIEKLKKKYPKYVRIIRFEKNIKLGGAVNHVTRRHLNGKVIGFTCADGEVSAADTVKLAKNILNNKDISLIKTIRLNRTDGARFYISWVYNLLVKSLFGIKTEDVNGWPVLLRYEDFKKMHLRNYSWIFQLEYLYQTKKMNRKFSEIEVEHQRRRGGVSKVKLEDIIIFSMQIIRYRILTFLQGK